jgi:hypothetical protein
MERESDGRLAPVDPAHLPVDLPRPFAADEMTAWKGSKAVGNVKNNENNPLLNLFDNLSPAVKQPMMSAHGLAPNPADDRAGITRTFIPEIQTHFQAGAAASASALSLGSHP